MLDAFKHLKGCLKLCPKVSTEFKPAYTVDIILAEGPRPYESRRALAVRPRSPIY